MATKKVVLDPGHGGYDPGAVDVKSGTDTIYTEEEDRNLAIALKTRDALVRCGVAVKMTRTGDTYPSLATRCSIANNWGAHRFVSMHCNAGASTARGVEVLYYPVASSKKLATNLYNYISQATTWVDRGIKPRSDLYVLRTTKMPAALIEYGFITNPGEEKLLASPNYQQRLANLTAKGICKDLGVPYVP